ncbi:MAG: sigma-70 family RNA polymerase sigma factor [Acidobacteriia bacterium]|nr:sigma-70 family RNA polymerase sigma factor [Terriglobia bacterium]
MNAPSRSLDQAALPEDCSAFEPVFQAYYERTARLIARLVNDPACAEELAVEVFWKLWRNPQAHGDAVGGWLYRTAVRAGLYELRRQARRARVAHLLRLGADRSTPEDQHAANQQQEHVRRVLATMPPHQAELLLLRSQDLSYAELASALNLNPASVGTLLSRAQQAFRKEYVKRYGTKTNRR